MQVPLEITYRNVPEMPELDLLIREKAAKLERFCDHISSCRVAVEKRHESQQTGQPYRVRIELNVPPGHRLVSSKDSSGGDVHTELPTVVRQAFEAARRQLEKLTAQQRGEVKQHPQQETMALVERLHTEEGYGFLRTVDGRSIYFHKNSVLNYDFDTLSIGTGVRFVEREGDEGPQASSVQITEKPPTG
jgi:cold shock CspA family protein